MRLKFTQDAHIQIGTADGVVTHRHKAGETVDIAADLAALFLEQGVAEPVKAEKATKTKE